MKFMPKIELNAATAFWGTELGGFEFKQLASELRQWILPGLYTCLQ